MLNIVCVHVHVNFNTIRYVHTYKWKSRTTRAGQTLRNHIYTFITESELEIFNLALNGISKLLIVK